MEKIRYAVMSDIHGNFEAFKTCVDYAIDQGIDKFIFLGDYLGEFPNPQDTLKLIYRLRDEYECYFVKGNKEDYWLDRKYNPDCEWKKGGKSVGAMHYCYDNLTEEDIQFFESLPVSIVINKRGYKTIIACHGTPTSNRAHMRENDEATLKHIMNYPGGLIVCGHTHWQRKIDNGDKYAINVGAIGISSCTGGPYAQFAILEGDENGYVCNFISLEYDHEREIALMKASDLYTRAPYWCDAAAEVVRHGTSPSLAELLERVVERDAGQNPWYNIPDECWKTVISEATWG